MNENLIAVLQARFELAVKAEFLEEGEIEIAQRALTVLLERYEDTVDAIESAILLDKLDADNEPAYATAGDKAWNAHVQSRKLREGVDNDGLTEDEANAALDEHVCSENCPPA